MTRTPIALLLAAGVLAAVPSAAAAATTCGYSTATHKLTIASDLDFLIVGRAGTSITVRNGGVPVDCTGDDPTVENTDRIVITDSSAGKGSLYLDLQEGRFAPGFSGEGQFGTPEIEVDVYGGGDENELRIFNPVSADVIHAGTVDGTETRLNLNAGEYLDDADIVATGISFVHVHGADGPDTIDGRGGAATGGPLQAEATFLGGGGADALFAGGADTLLGGNEDDDTLTGGGQDDTLGGGLGNDTLDGGLGVDTLLFSKQFPPGIRADLGDVDPQDTNEGIDTLSDIEGVSGTDWPDVLRAGSRPGTLLGHGGDDVLEGNSKDDILDGGDGTDTADYSETPNQVAVDLGASAPQATGPVSGDDTLTSVENVTGSFFDDVITGTDGPNVIHGDGGDDQIEALGGDDTVIGGTGAELEPEGADLLDGGTGIDTLSYADRKQRVAIRLDGLKNDGADPNGDGVSTAAEEGDQALGIENVIGGSGADRLFALGNAVNVFKGGGGGDRLNGGPGADVLDGGAGIDTLSYVDRTARVAVRLDGLKNDGADPNGDGFSTAGEENDHALGIENVVGGDGGDRIVALLAAVNVLTGGPGADFINAKDNTAAPDTLDCGTGTDTYTADPADKGMSCEVAG